MATGARRATRIRKPRRDKLDPGGGPVAMLAMRGLIILPQESYEEGRGWVTHEGLDVFILPSSTVDDPPRRFVDGDVIASDLLDIDGERWQVEGPPAAYDKGAMRKATRLRISRVGGA